MILSEVMVKADNTGLLIHFVLLELSARDYTLLVYTCNSFTNHYLQIIRQIQRSNELTIFSKMQLYDTNHSPFKITVFKAKQPGTY